MFVHSLELYADLSQYVIPIAAGAAQLAEGKFAAAGAFLLAGAIHQFVVPNAKKLFPNAIRPNGKIGSFPSTHTSAACMGAFFSLSREGITASSMALVGLASLTAFSRWKTKHHWPVDLLGGATMGALIAFSTDAFLRLNSY